jgi:hypothetical protein
MHIPSRASNQVSVIAKKSILCSTTQYFTYIALLSIDRVLSRARCRRLHSVDSVPSQLDLMCIRLLKLAPKLRRILLGLRVLYIIEGIRYIPELSDVSSCNRLVYELLRTYDIP